VNELRQIIEREIRERGPIPFSRYMELCLYHPELGYYSRHAAQFGKTGDFYTSSDVHAVFGRLLARQFDEMWRVMGGPARIVVRELGPGRGLFARDVLDWAEKKFPDFFAAVRYEMVEQSAALRERIGETLKRHVEAGKAAMHDPGPAEVGTDGKGTTSVVPKADLSTPALAAEGDIVSGKSGTPGAKAQSSIRRHGTTEVVPFPSVPSPEASLSLQSSLPIILFANEFFDAFPVEIVSPHGSMRIDVQDGRFVEAWVPASAEELEFLDRYSVHPEEGERVEVPMAAQQSFSDAMDFDRGFAVVIDYGYTRAEQLAGRHRGTVKAIRQHAVSANPYEAPGEQDITADVNFTALATAAERRGMHAQKLVTQSQFLMGIGEANQFADAFEDCRLPQERAKVALQLKHLVTPAGMGESFQVLVASKGLDAGKVSALAGLGFGRRLSPSRE
jgi:SAM-dependent MidA family methyltransferase